MTYKKLDIKQSIGYLFSTMINIMEINTGSIEIDKITHEGIDTIYDIEYFNNVGTLHIIFNNVDAYFMLINEDKYLIFAIYHISKEIEIW